MGSKRPEPAQCPPPREDFPVSPSPPRRKVVQRFWISRKESSDGSYYGAWFATEQDPKSWIRTDETREVEQ